MENCSSHQNKQLEIRTLIAGSVGNILEWYDFALYGFFAPIIASLFFPSGDKLTSLIAAFGVFAAGFLMRPIGAAIFGHFGDKVGRKSALTASVILMAIPTTLVGILPTHAQIGIAAPILLTLLRLVQGISVGGEFTGSISFLVENAPPERRGYWGSWSNCTGNLGILLGAGVGALVTSLIPHDAMIGWGWRIPFLLGILVGFAGLYLRKGLKEPPGFKSLAESGEISSSPVPEALRKQRKAILTAVGATFLPSICFYTIFVYLTTFVSSETHIPLSEALDINTVSMAVLIIFIPVMGHLSDRTGRKSMLILASVLIALLAYPLFLVLSMGNPYYDLGAQIVFGIIYAMVSGTLPTMLVEMFPTKLRMTALSLAYNIAMAVFGGTAPLVATFLIQQTGNKMVPGFYLMFSALVSLVVYIRLRETYKEPLR